MKDSKLRLFEMMERLNPNINTTDDNEFSDVKMVDNLKTDALKTAQSKINTQEEFRQAFENWFSSLGVSNKYKDKFNSTTAINHIRDIFDKFDIKP